MADFPVAAGKISRFQPCGYGNDRLRSMHASRNGNLQPAR
jgi:hypothetical protein